MSTLTDIQRLVDKAQGKSAWDEIVIVIGQCTDLEYKYREDFAERLHQQLDKRGLQGNPEPIDVMKILKQVKADWLVKVNQSAGKEQKLDDSGLPTKLKGVR